MTTRTCPPLKVLEAFAASSCADADVAGHVDACAICRAAVEEARANNEFIAGVRTALAAQGATARAPKESPAPVEPDLVSGYQIQEEIHRGGQGVIHRAVQTRTRRTVAIKMLLAGPGATERQKERFEREVRIAAALRHPNIVTVHDNGYISDGRYGLVMEYIEGVPLDRWSRSLDGARGRDAQRKALRERLGVMVKICDAVLCAHQHSIVHRDLKPANILVDRAGEPHILDFGIARDTGPAQNTRLTHTGEFAGTLAYASPEQVSGDLSRVDTRTDIYSLGVIMYELVSGKRPYPIDGPMSRIVRSIETTEPAPLPRRTSDPDDPWVDGDVSTIILKAMAKDPARRYQTAAGLRNDISRYLAGEAIEARRDSTWYVLRKSAARHRVVVAAAGLIFVMLAAFGAVMALQARRLEVRGRELASALSESNVERGRALAAAGDLALAEETVWPELIRAGMTRTDWTDTGFAGPPAALHAYWALWDIFRKASNLAILHTHGKSIILLYFDEDGRRLCAVDNDGNLISWSVTTWGTVRDVSLVAPIDGMFFEAANAVSGAVAIFGGGVIRTFDSAMGAAEAPDDKSCSGTFSPDGRLLATIGIDKRLRLWDAGSLEPTLTIAERVVLTSNNLCQPAFSLDGRHVAAGRLDGSVGLWSTSSGVLERTLRPPESLASLVRDGATMAMIAFGSDGTIAASLGGPRSNMHVVIWPADGSAPLDLGVHHSVISSLSFLPGSEGRMLVSSGSVAGGGIGVTIVWDLTVGKRAVTIGHAVYTTTCAASPDGRLIAVGHLDGTIQVYENRPDPHVAVLHAGSGTGTVAAVSRDGRLVALTSGAQDSTGRDVLLIDLKSRTTMGRFHREGPATLGLEFAADGLSLFDGQASGRVMRWDLRGGTTGREYAAPDLAPDVSGEHREPLKPDNVMGLNQMRLSPDGSVLARARRDGVIDLWDVASGRWLGRLDGGPRDNSVIDFSHDSGTLAARDWADKCVLWDVRTRQIKRTITIGMGTGGMRCSPIGPVFASGVFGSIHLFASDTGRVLVENKVPGSSGVAMAFHPGGNVLFASAQAGAIRLWDTRTGRELLSLQKPNGTIYSLSLTPDGNTLISSDSTGTVLAWDLAYYNAHIRRELEYRASRSAVP